MPGRGQPWKLGKGVADRIGTKAIADGSITEADLDSNVTAKLNAGGGGHTIQDEGSPLVQRTNLNFKGAGVVASDGIEDTTDVTIAGGGGTLSREELAKPFTDFWFYDEFFYPNPAVGLLTHFELDVNNVDAVNNSVGGVINYQTTVVANNVARLNICGAGLQAIDSSKKLILRVRARLAQGPTDVAWMVGFFSSQSNGPGGTFPFSSKTTNGLGFLLDGSGNIETYTDDNITPVTQDTGVAQDTLVHTYEIEFNPVGTIITWKIDDVIVATQTTNLPSFNGAFYSNLQTGATAGKDIELDSLFIFNER